MSMTESLYDPNATPTEGEQDHVVRIRRSDLKALEANKAKAAQTDALARELAFVKAGVNTDSPVGSLLFKAYDGELDPGKIREYASQIPGALGQTQTPPADGQTQPPADGQTQAPADGTPPAPTGNQPPEQTYQPPEARSTLERQILATGAESNGEPPKPDPRTQAQEIHKQLLSQGANSEEALAGAFSTLAKAAVSGDKRVIFDPRAMV